METKPMYSENIFREIEDALSDNYSGKVYNENYEGKVYNDDYEGDDWEEDYDGQEGEELEVFDAFDGDPETDTIDDIEIYEHYEGSEEDDDFVDFMGQRGLNLKKYENSSKRFGFKVTNTTTEDKTIAISTGPIPDTRVAVVYNDNGLKYKRLGGYVANAPTGYTEHDAIVEYNNPENLRAVGIMVDAVLDDGYIFQSNSIQYVRATALKKTASIRQFKEYVKKAPTVFAKMHIGSDKTEFYKTQIILKKASPYGVFEDDIIPLEDYYKPEAFNKDKIEVNKKFQLDNETVMIMTIPAGATVTFSLVAGVSLNPGVALVRKIQKATKGKRVRKLRGVVKGLHRRGFRFLRRPGRRPHGRRIKLFGWKYRRR